MSLLMSLYGVLFQRDVLDDIWDLIGSIFEGFPTYFFKPVDLKLWTIVSNILKLCMSLFEHYLLTKVRLSVRSFATLHDIGFV